MSFAIKMVRFLVTNKIIMPDLVGRKSILIGVFPISAAFGYISMLAPCLKMAQNPFKQSWYG